MIPFNKPFLTGNETKYIEQAVASGKISGNGMFTKKCQHFFESKFGIKKALLTTSCTDALEMCALLLDVTSEDEIIIPSYTFVSTANAFALRGAKIVFADASKHHPNIDASKIEALITKQTKAIVVVHYAGVSCDMDAIMSIAKKHDIYVVEDAAQAIDSYYKGRPLGSIGHLATFSFHETKNIISGEGGLLAINDERFIERSEIIWEKGTNRSAFFRGEIDKYGWVDLGSSFLPSEVIAAFLWAQLENLDSIQNKRKQLWNAYNKALKVLAQAGHFKLPQIEEHASNNAHLFYIICKTNQERQALIEFLKSKDIKAVFHYLSLHKSSYYTDKHDGRALEMTDYYADHLLRLPLFYELELNDIDYIVSQIQSFYEN
ncbi:dTDP-4-amino-4,6-dideoxygalactose transaminase [Psychroserpens luteolus]|uniref:dTDP-4-amino-4,6-dideoxygalactose transaminase n=1 Tax=Psychroserpens luteolus TaxID=2855840 RepID=UPI001E4CD900|nr:dTDP-4-amino-4,6-dideoxygalactose transaminase [Psychroserpens luteolus]MCD2259792.1 dTDP-4-amino-4,6-dideoxygalactose transaminase [Psychroserpens luteolus]